MSKLSNRVAAGGLLVAASLAMYVATLPSVDADKAYLWIDENGGTCEVYDPPETYVDGEACASFDEAWDAAEGGWTVRVKSGTYGPQVVGGQKFAPVLIIGEDGTEIDSEDQHNAGLGLNGMVTVENVDVGGNTPFVAIGGQRSTWSHARLLEGAEGEDARSCEFADAEPITIYTDSPVPIRSARLQNIVIEEQHYRPAEDDTCSGEEGYHLELLRIDQNVDRVLIDSVFFSECPNCGSGLMFITTPDPSIPGPRNVVIRNSIFEGSTAYSFQMHTNVDECEGYVFAYNTFKQDNSVACGTESSDVRWIGNTGPRPLSAPCKEMKFIRNVWQADTFGYDFRCGNDTIVQGTQYGYDQLELNADWTPQAGSPVIDAAEFPAFDDYCTGPLAADDFAENVRPFGAACDAGAYEWQGP